MLDLDAATMLRIRRLPGVVPRACQVTSQKSPLFVSVDIPETLGAFSWRADVGACVR